MHEQPGLESTIVLRAADVFEDDIVVDDIRIFVHPTQDVLVDMQRASYIASSAQWAATRSHAP